MADSVATPSGERSVTEVARIAATAFDHMNRHGVAPTPANYLLWYTYSEGSRSDVKKSIDRVIAEGKPITEEKCRELHDKFFGFEKDNSAMLEIGAAIEAAVSGALDTVSTAGKDAADYGEALQDAAGTMAKNRSPEAMAKVMQQMILRTNEMVSRNKELENALGASTAEISQLKTSLDEVRTEATTDALTGVPNRKRFDSFLADAMRNKTKNGLCLLMMDIDHFKKFNDTHGHQMGDKVLKLVAKTIEQNVREGDLPARYGGEEFSVVLPNTDLTTAEEIGDRIREAVAKKRIIQRSSGVALGQITLSVGGAAFQSGEEIQDLIERADSCLYDAKRSGRNRVVMEKI